MFSLPLGKSSAAPHVLDSLYPFTSEPPTLLPTVSLSTEAAPFPELPPSHEIPLNILAPSFTPRASRLSWTEVTNPTSKPDTSYDFTDLIAVLVELSANGNPRPRFSTVSPL